MSTFGNGLYRVTDGNRTFLIWLNVKKWYFGTHISAWPTATTETITHSSIFIHLSALSTSHVAGYLITPVNDGFRLTRLAVIG
jgi:hypothetical protein